MMLVLAVALLAAAPADEIDKAALRAYVAAVIQRGGGEAPPATNPAVQRWAGRNRTALTGLRRDGVLPEQPWGLTASGPAAHDGVPPIYLYVLDWHVSGKLVVYGLTGGVKQAYLLGDEKRSALPAERAGNSTIFSVPKTPPDPLAAVVVLEFDAKPQTASLAVRPGADGRITLHARDAIVHGRTVRYEPDPHKNTVGYWTDPHDWVSWEFEITRPGAFASEITQGCGERSGGSVVDFSVGDESLTVTVEDTGGFQNFANRNIGTFHFAKPGHYTLTVKPKHKPGLAVMDLRQVTLTPVEK